MRVDLHSQTWVTIQAYLNERLATLRTSLEADLPEEKTQRIRARIAEIKQLLDMVNPEQPLVDPAEPIPE